MLLSLSLNSLLLSGQLSKLFLICARHSVASVDPENISKLRFGTVLIFRLTFLSKAGCSCRVFGSVVGRTSFCFSCYGFDNYFYGFRDVDLSWFDCICVFGWITVWNKRYFVWWGNDQVKWKCSFFSNFYRLFVMYYYVFAAKYTDWLWAHCHPGIHKLHKVMRAVKEGFASSWLRHRGMDWLLGQYSEAYLILL